MTKPICDVCGKEVETFEESVDLWFDRLVFVVRCHGDYLRVTIDQSEDAKNITFGRAFVQPRRLTP